MIPSNNLIKFAIWILLVAALTIVVYGYIHIPANWKSVLYNYMVHSL